MKLCQAMVYAKDLPKMADFYGRILGLEPIAETRTESWVEFASGFALHAIPPHIAEEIVIADPPEVREETPIKLIFEVEDLGVEQVRLAGLGATLMPRPWGVCDAVDPEGNVFQIRPSAQ